MKVNFSEYINDMIRALIILDVSNNYKSVKLTERRIELYDFFLRFPRTMTLTTDSYGTNAWSFEECYSFFHWQPDIIRYRQALNFLIAKGFAIKELSDNAVVYKITDLGKTFLSKLNNPYKDLLVELMTNNAAILSKLSDKRIEELIQEKSKMHMRRRNFE